MITHNSDIRDTDSEQGAGMGQRDWVPDTIDVNQPSMARMYDYALGGSHNFAVDREAAEKVLAANPDGRLGMFANRAFLRRAVRFMVGAGITQFLDIGSGIPTAGNVHEVAQDANPDCRVVYVDVDPVAVLHGRRMLADNGRVTAIHSDIRDPERILANPDLLDLLDLNRPVGLLMLCVLHFVPDDQDPAGLVARYRDRLAPGSYLTISHVTGDDPSDTHQEAMKTYSQVMTKVNLRSRDQVAAMFDGFDLVDPGLVWIPRWRPDPGEDASATLYYYSGVGIKP
ncbi:MAG TPA: SAM-dependent methyltransferase [Mycobacteriales bacterium]